MPVRPFLILVLTIIAAGGLTVAVAASVAGTAGLPFVGMAALALGIGLRIWR